MFQKMNTNQGYKIQTNDKVIQFTCPKPATTEDAHLNMRNKSELSTSMVLFSPKRYYSAPLDNIVDTVHSVRPHTFIQTLTTQLTET